MWLSFFCDLFLLFFWGGRDIELLTNFFIMVTCNIGGG